MTVDDSDNVIILLSVDNVGGLDNNLLEPFSGKFVHGLADVVDLDSVALPKSLNDHFTSESPSDLPIWEVLLHQILKSIDCLDAVLVVGRSKTGYEYGLLDCVHGFVGQYIQY